ncbi:phospho-sugar mutase [Aureisphaera galaxeae]|uniref:phospho-sugar mutase n=1 Tax=Aureisphaera galaxeae TaxID=1538023 RepID=UPI00235062AE|nr:phospho-sugar mutase [Aureisphaera galaxeae]MDC8003620.1 phospho-sugar mutase [Aureisphaera galaxeae]
MRYIDPELLEKANKWLTPFFDSDTQHTIKELIAYDSETLEDSFYKSLEFGTGGMRGVMGVGDNRINKYTLGKNTQGISQYLKKQFPGEDLKVVIAYDCRHNSDTLAKVVADVFSANGIQVYLFSELRPTPELSFAVRHLDCHCGIVLTASHNPPEYNGYKVYWQDGGQLVPPQDAEIIQEINDLDYTDIDFEANEALIQWIDQEVDDVFASASVANGSFNTDQAAKDGIKIVFTPLHGTSVTMIPRVLKEAGYNNVTVVEAQAKPDGDFPTVESPNPEEPEALEMAMQIAEKEGADIVIGTDPDSDRLGIAVRNTEGQMTLLNGNQAMVVKSHFLLDQWKKQGKLDENTFMASTIVSTPMLKKIAEDFNVRYREGLTGFKWIAKMVKDFPEENFVGGGEESFGFMVGDFVRDKDAVTSTLLACELTAQKKAAGSSVFEYLHELYNQYGHFQEHLVSLVKKGKKGAEEIANTLKGLRENPPMELGGEKVICFEDYQHSIRKDITAGTETPIDIPKSNVLIYYTDGGSKVAARPSGTEPKIKFYMSVQGPNAEQLPGKIESILADLNLN